MMTSSYRLLNRIKLWDEHEIIQLQKCVAKAEMCEKVRLLFKTYALVFSVDNKYSIHILHSRFLIKMKKRNGIKVSNFLY